jgi:hypothetical protein
METLPEALLEHVLFWCEAGARQRAASASAACAQAALAVDGRRTVLVLGPSTPGTRHEFAHLVAASMYSHLTQ